MKRLLFIILAFSLIATSACNKVNKADEITIRDIVKNIMLPTLGYSEITGHKLTYHDINVKFHGYSESEGSPIYEVSITYDEPSAWSRFIHAYDNRIVDGIDYIGIPTNSEYSPHRFMNYWQGGNNFFRTDFTIVEFQQCREQLRWK